MTRKRAEIKSKKFTKNLFDKNKSKILAVMIIFIMITTAGTALILSNSSEEDGTPVGQDFTYTSHNGEQKKLTDYRGKFG